MAKRSVCFFANVRDRSILSRNEFYAQDLRILEELGFTVLLASSPSQIRPANYYFVWWWTYAFLPILLAKALRRPVLVTGVLDSQHFSSRSSYQQYLMRFALAHADANVFVSQQEYRDIPRLYRVREPHYVPLTVNTDTYRPGADRFADLIFTVIWMNGPNATRKCAEEIIRAASLVHQVCPRVRFMIAGDRGTAFPALEALAREVGATGYIDFPGVISKGKKIELMQRCTIYLQPSRYEGFGMAILEAMSCGAPVITSPVGAVPEVAGDAAILVDGTSPEAIAGAILDLLNKRNSRAALGASGRTRAEELYPYARRKRDMANLLSCVYKLPDLGVS